jgi:hypothetical protein
MLVLMFDPRFKDLPLVSSFIGRDQEVAIVEQYDTMSLYAMLMKCYYHLHPSIQFNNDFANERLDDDNSLNIFQLTTRNTKQAKEFVKRELLVF